MRRGWQRRARRAARMREAVRAGAAVRQADVVALQGRRGLEARAVAVRGWKVRAL